MIVLVDSSPLHDAHTRFRLSADEFDEAGAEIVRALEHFA